MDRFGRPVGSVRKVLLHADEAFDGIIVGTPAGDRFVDAPEVRRMSRGAVSLGISASDIEEPRHRGARGVPQARHGRTAVTEDDRDAAIEVLKRAFVRDELDIEQLGERVVVAHDATELSELDALIGELEEDAS